MPKLMLIDGNSLVNRAYYGVRPLSAPDGTPTNAVFGFLNILQRLLDDEKPDALCVMFDRREPTFRHKHSEAYKATRKPMPDDLAAQMPVLKDVLDALGIERRELSGWEADDLLGTVSRIGAEQGWECVVVTGDKDALQLVGEHVRVLNVKTRMGQTETVNYTPERFREEYGFDAPHMIDLKALMGDTSDNIPGVPGVGEKTALELVRKYGSLAGVYEHISDPDIRASLRTKLENGKESAEDSYYLATIDRKAPIDISPDELRRPADYGGAAYAIFQRLGFQKFIEKWGLKPAAEEKKEETVFEGTCESVTPQTEKDLRAALERAGDAVAYYWFDAESGETSAHFSVSENDALAVFLTPEAYRDGYTAALALLFAPERRKAGHDVKNLQRALLARGVDALENWVFDSALAGYLLDATAAGYEIEKLTLAYCGFTPHTSSGAADSGDQLMLDLSGGEGKTLADRLGEMASRAASVAALEEVMLPKLRETQMEELFTKIELPLCAVLAKMENEGFLADAEALRAFGESLTGSIDALREAVWAEAGEEFNIQSPKQLGAVLFEKLGLPGGKKTKTGWSTNADVLDKLRYEPIVRHVLEYRELTKLKSTYADGLLKVIGADGRIHTNFQMTVTATGRLSSTEPNLQNIPVRRELGAGLRKMFVAAPGNVLVDADYSQIELRLLAHISGDEAMRAAFLSGEDVHRVTASQVFGVPLEDVTAEERRRAKAVNFGIVYGISAFSLAQDIGVSYGEAKEYMDAYFARFRGVRDYQKEAVRRAKALGYAETLFHRRRYLPELNVPALRAFGERVALNMPIQGTAADVIKLAMVHVDQRLRAEGMKAKLILQVHDELIVECPEAEREKAVQVLREEMEHAAAYTVPLTADAGWGRNWAEAHGT